MERGACLYRLPLSQSPHMHVLTTAIPFTSWEVRGAVGDAEGCSSLGMPSALSLTPEDSYIV